ncbi:MAG: LysR substrate-binding domain-containing protein [Pigmentiphaga sp.]
MDMARLQTLRALSQHGTMAAAAVSLHLTPSAVSQQITQLERELDSRLTERRGRRVALTVAGEALVRHTERMLAIMDEAKAELAQLRGELAGELRVAAFPSIAAAVLAETVRVLQAAHPRLRVVVQEKEPREGLMALGAWQADVALIDDLATDPEGCHDRYVLRALAQDRLHILLPVSHPLAARPFLEIVALRDAAWALDSTSSSFGEFFTDLCCRAGFEPRINAHCTGFEMVAAMVASGCSVSMASGLRLAKPLNGIAAVPLRPEIQRRILVACRKEEAGHPAIQAFMETVQHRVQACFA